MSTGAGRARLILAVAFRNLWLDRLRTAVIGALIAFGAFLAVIGLSLLKDVQASMRASITASIAGDLQLYSAEAKDDLAIFGGSFMGRADIGSLPDLVTFRDAVLKNPNVQAFIPMGIDMAILGRGNELDDSLDALRVALKSKDPAIVTSRVAQLRFQMEQLQLELTARRNLVADAKEIDQQETDLHTAQAPAFLADPAALDENKLQFLETKIAPLSGEKPPIYLQYVGTDIELYKANFPKFHVVEGKALGAGERGIMLSKKVREDLLKNSCARIFDQIHKKLKRGGKIAGDAELTRDAKDLKRQYQQILSYLDRADAEALSAKLTAFGLPAEGTDLVQSVGKQLTSFLTVDDANFAKRYDWFYENIAPHIRLYEISPGQTITLRSYTKSGYVKTVPLKVYGVYSFDGLEDSDLAGVMNITDLVSFRELYGQMTEASRKELEQMRTQVGVKEVKAEDAEAALFGGSAPATTTTEAPPAATTSEPIKVKPFLADTFDPDEVRHGLALNAAIKLKDPTLEKATLKDLSRDLAAAGLKVKVIDWQQASGIVGQFVNIVGITLVFALGVIFLVAFVIINNSIIVGTLNRTREIGTMRAIGAPRSFVVLLFLAETGITGLLGAVGGTLLALLALTVAGRSGIPSGNDVVTFLFSGPRLYPHLHWTLIATAPILITFVATLASIYAARHAARIQPADATQEKE